MNQHNSAPLPKWTYSLALLPAVVFFLGLPHSQDQEWFLKINHLCANIPDVVWTNLSMMGNGWSLFALTFPLILFARKQLYAGVISGIFTGIFSNLCKSFFSTNRPAGVIDTHLFHIIENPLLNNAMPSGHTMTAFSVATAIFFSIDTNKRSQFIFLFILAIATGVSRIAVGAHWPEDVLVGASLGIFAGLIGAQLVQKLPSSYLELNAWPLYLVVITSFVSFYLLVTDKIDFYLNHSSQLILAGVILMTWIKLFQVMKLTRRT